MTVSLFLLILMICYNDRSMKIYIFTLLALSLTLTASFAYAQTKDSYYFMADDGVQTKEEMEEEAMYVHQSCDSNSYKKALYSCECVAGAFLQKREELGSIAPQAEIKEMIYRGNLGQCADPIKMAGETYTSCMEQSKILREYKKDNEEYCSCVANTFAMSFAKRPYLRTSYIEDLKVRALTGCEHRDINNRPIKN